MNVSLLHSARLCTRISLPIHSLGKLSLSSPAVRQSIPTLQTLLLRTTQNHRFSTSSSSMSNSNSKSADYDKHAHRAGADQHVEGDVNSTDKTSFQDTHPEGKDGWKTRPPYKIHEDDTGFDVKHEGNCHCGKVKYQLSREKPLASKYCHCTTCQRIHGAPFQWAAIFHKDDINFTHGHHDLAWYDSQDKTTVHKLPCKVSCAYCRTPIMDEGRNMILLFPTLIKFQSPEDRKKFEPTCHMFYPQRVVDIPDGKTKWTGIDNDSEVMENADKERL